MTITYAIIGITVLVSMYALSNPGVQRGLMMNPYLVDQRKQYYRLVTSGFIHGDHMHLIVNMFSFYFFGSAVESIFGYLYGDASGIYFIIFYLLAIVFSDLPTLFKQRKNPGYNSLGASGGVSAIIFAFIIFLPLEKICLYGIFCLPGFILGTAYIIYSYFQGKNSRDNVNHDAHLYGAVFGLVFCAVMQPNSIPRFFEQIAEWDFFK